MDCSLPGSSVLGNLQARILEWVAMLSSKGSSRPRDQSHMSYVSVLAGGFFTKSHGEKSLSLVEILPPILWFSSVLLLNYISITCFLGKRITVAFSEFKSSSGLNLILPSLCEWRCILTFTCVFSLPFTFLRDDSPTLHRSFLLMSHLLLYSSTPWPHSGLHHPLPRLLQQLDHWYHPSYFESVQPILHTAADNSQNRADHSLL